MGFLLRKRSKKYNMERLYDDSTNGRTDHQQGKVLAAAVHLDVIGVVAKAAEDRIVIQSDGFPEIVTETHRVSKFGGIKVIG